MADQSGNNVPPAQQPPPGQAAAQPVAQPVTIDQIRGLLAPFAQQLDTLQGQVATLQKKKPEHLVDPATVKWKKEGSRLQYTAWTEAWDHMDKARDAVTAGNQEGAREALKQGIDFVESKMRDVLCANTYGWDWVAEFNAPPLSRGGDDESKFRKTSKAVHQKRLERDRLKNKKFGNFSKFTGGNGLSMWQMRKIFAAIQSGDTNLSELISSKPRVAPHRAGGFGDRNRYAGMTCNHCGLVGHIWSGCPSRAGSKTASSGSGP